MTQLPPCPKCNSEYTYQDQAILICPECAHEWAPQGERNTSEEDTKQVRDSNGNPLAEGDFVTVIKDLKIKGSSSVIKVGTKIKILRLVDGDHDIDCKIEGIGPMMLKSE